MLVPHRRHAAATAAAAAAAALILVSAAQAQQKACNQSAPPAVFCDEFCNSKCSFFNASAGESGRPQTLTVYRLTPSHITDLPNKDSGDPNGDLSFFLSRHNLRAECAVNPHAHGNGCFLAGQDVFVKVELQVDGLFGPYLMCNPLHGWANETNAADWSCSTDCLSPPDCPWPRAEPQNGTRGVHGPTCSCPASDRTNRTVGRANRTSYYAAHRVAAGILHRQHSSEGSSFKGVEEKLGGFWYSTPRAGECTQPGAEPGDGSGCSWKVKRLVKKINATCVGRLVDRSIEVSGAACFGACPGFPKNKTSSCYDTCYIEALMGSSSEGGGGGSGMSVSEILAPWEVAFGDGPRSCPDLARPDASEAEAASRPGSAAAAPASGAACSTELDCELSGTWCGQIVSRHGACSVRVSTAHALRMWPHTRSHMLAVF
eukprot:SAG11_NODE_2087_length_3845_cov_5.794447_1_plen_430_part_00